MSSPKIDVKLNPNPLYTELIIAFHNGFLVLLDTIIKFLDF